MNTNGDFELTYMSVDMLPANPDQFKISMTDMAYYYIAINYNFVIEVEI